MTDSQKKQIQEGVDPGRRSMTKGNRVAVGDLQQVSILCGYGLRVNIRGILEENSRVRPSWCHETKLPTGWAPLENAVPGPGNERVMLEEPGVVKDNRWR